MSVFSLPPFVCAAWVCTAAGNGAPPATEYHQLPHTPQRLHVQCERAPRVVLQQGAAARCGGGGGGGGLLLLTPPSPPTPPFLSPITLCVRVHLLLLLLCGSAFGCLTHAQRATFTTSLHRPSRPPRNRSTQFAPSTSTKPGAVSLLLA